ncbi:MAG: helix-turn-helix domain-containing protein [Bacteroidales bacterium]|nr:helix-turn-helix domain-containing protein [Bacteroidales bacterium]
MMTLKETAKATSLSTSHLYHLVDDNSIPHYRFGRAIRFKRSEIEEWMRTKRVYTKQEIDHQAETYTAIR